MKSRNLAHALAACAAGSRQQAGKTRSRADAGDPENDIQKHCFRIESG